jgi:uncharacterized membrane protein
MLPDWAPNLHPLVVHFPIALLVAAALVDVVSLGTRRRYPAVRHAAVGLYVLAAVGALGTYLSGRSGIDVVDIPLAAVTAANDHADWALWLVWTAGIYAALRLGVAFWKRSGDLAVHVPLLLLGLVPLFLVQQTAERGGKLVYLYGVGVRAVTAENPTRHDQAAHGMGADDHMSGDSAMAGMDHGASAAAGGDVGATWAWTPGDDPLPAGTRFVEGDRAALAATRASGALVVRPRRPVLFVAGEPVGDVQVEATLDLSQFTGTVMLVHHVRSRQDYDFFAVDTPASGPPTLRQGRVEGGRTTVFADKTMPLAEPLAEPVHLTAVAAGGHFRGLVAGELATHGHGDAAEPGAVGLRIAGSGPVGIQRLAATAVE